MLRQPFVHMHTLCLMYALCELCQPTSGRFVRGKQRCAWTESVAKQTRADRKGDERAVCAHAVSAAERYALYMKGYTLPIAWLPV